MVFYLQFHRDKRHGTACRRLPWEAPRLLGGRESKVKDFTVVYRAQVRDFTVVSVRKKEQDGEQV